MGSFRRRTARDDEARAKRALDGAVAVLRQCERNGITAVPVADVLEMLGAGPEPGPAPETAPRDPRADPITGCLPATPG